MVLSVFHWILKNGRFHANSWNIFWFIHLPLMTICTWIYLFIWIAYFLPFCKRHQTLISYVSCLLVSFGPGFIRCCSAACIYSVGFFVACLGYWFMVSLRTGASPAALWSRTDQRRVRIWSKLGWLTLANANLLFKLAPLVHSRSMDQHI